MRTYVSAWEVAGLICRGGALQKKFGNPRIIYFLFFSLCIFEWGLQENPQNHRHSLMQRTASSQGSYAPFRDGS